MKPESKNKKEAEPDNKEPAKQEIYDKYHMALDTLKNLINTQKQHGNYNCDEYMYGMLIGLECALYSVQGLTGYEYTPRPKQFLSDLKKLKPQIQNIFPDEE